jgi:hypothetical protein
MEVAERKKDRRTEARMGAAAKSAARGLTHKLLVL